MLPLVIRSTTRDEWLNDGQSLSTCWAKSLSARCSSRQDRNRSVFFWNLKLVGCPAPAMNPSFGPAQTGKGSLANGNRLTRLCARSENGRAVKKPKKEVTYCRVALALARRVLRQRVRAPGARFQSTNWLGGQPSKRRPPWSSFCGVRRCRSFPSCGCQGRECAH